MALLLTQIVVCGVRPVHVLPDRLAVLLAPQHDLSRVALLLLAHAAPATVSGHVEASAALNSNAKLTLHENVHVLVVCGELT